MSAARITSFLVKVASRCNLDCDYCYMYHHADQSWRSMPRLLSEAHRAAFAERLAEYAREMRLERVSVILHGGEPLLAGAASLAAFARLIRDAVGDRVEVDVGLQTNGLLLTDEVLDVFERDRIAVSLSMDGPRVAQDLHRRSRRGRSSYDRVALALERLKRRPAIFAGVIAVIDPAVDPEELLAFFAGHGVPALDFLLPDSHHERPPPGRDGDPSLYERWLVRTFDAWLDRHPELPVRTFEALLDAAAGLPSGTDAFGLGDVSLLSVETDGTWHDLDVLKVAGQGATRLAGSVEDTGIADVAASPAIARHRRLLSREGLSAACQACPVVDVCGGGSVPHRHRGGGYDNPTIYCGEMKALIGHVRLRLRESLGADGPAEAAPRDLDLASFELAETGASVMAQLHRDALAEDLAGLMAAADVADPDLASRIPPERVAALARRAGSVAWQRAVRAEASGSVVRDVDGTPVSAGPEYLHRIVADERPGDALEVGVEDEWLRLPFGASIVFEDEPVAAEGRRLVAEALRIVEEWRPDLEREMRQICSAVQFVRDPTAHPDKIVSFSDDSVPGAMFVSIRHSAGLIDPYDLADSLVHEYRHQKLYLLERRHPTTRPGALVVSPWREDLRPASGLLHAIFVFVELRRFWEHVRDSGPTRLHNRAMSQIAETDRNLDEAFATAEGCELTETGRALLGVLCARARAPEPV